MKFLKIFLILPDVPARERQFPQRNILYKLTSRLGRTTN